MKKEKDLFDEVKCINLFDKVKYINECTGECYFSLFHAVTTIISDMIHIPACRTWEMWKISKVKIGGITEV